MNAGVIIATERLVLRPLDTTDADAEFMLGLLKAPFWLQFICDCDARTVEDAWAYTANGSVATYRERGFGRIAGSSRRRCCRPESAG